MAVERKIEQKIVEFIDAKLAGNGLFAHAVAVKDARTVFVMAAEVCVGIREVGGNNSGEKVELFQETVGAHNREPWCMSFVQTCLAYAELKTGVKSPLAATEHCMTLWNVTKIEQKVKHTPARGAIVIWNYKGTTDGHTGIFLESYKTKKGSMFRAVEGNTESGVSNGKVERDGGGVYLTERASAGSGSLIIKGYIKPF